MTIGLVRARTGAATVHDVMRPGAIERALERVLVPPVLNESAKARPRATWNDDFTRVVGLVAITAVGFFAPSLLIAGVPQQDWLAYLIAAGAAGVIVAGSFVFLRPGTRVANVGAIVNVFVVAGIAWLFSAYYHQLILLFVLVVAAEAIVHGIYPGLLAALLGSVLVPFVIQAGIPTNPTDPIYAFIYLSGAALVPWTAGRLAQRRAAALHDQLEVTTTTEREAVMALARAAEAKDHATGDHVLRVGDICASLALRAGMSDAEAEDLRFAAMLHDVGKLHLPDTVLQKPGPLTAEEWELVKLHTVWGERILGDSAGFELARRVARWHHENFDGTGYPDALERDAIPLSARIVRVADVFDALAHVRPYKDAWTVDRVLDEIRRGAGTLFDPDLAAEMIALVDAHVVQETPGIVGAIEQKSIVRGSRARAAVLGGS